MKTLKQSEGQGLVKIKVPVDTLVATAGGRQGVVSWLAPADEFGAFEIPAGEAKHSDAAWIYRYLHSQCRTPKTRKSVQAEMLRLAYFMVKHDIHRFNELSTDHGIRYREWLLSRHDWDDVNSDKRTPRYIGGQLNPKWRPFRSTNPLSENAAKTALSLLSAVFAFMNAAPECAVTGNPFHGLSKKVSEKKAIDDINSELHPYRKALSLSALNAIRAYIESDEFVGHERSRAANRWLVELLYSTAARVETIVALNSLNLVPNHYADSGFDLVFVAKGNRQVTQIWSSEQMQALRRYRDAIGLNWPPAPEEPNRLWLGIGRQDVMRKGVTEQSLWKMVAKLGKQVHGWLHLAKDEADWRWHCLNTLSLDDLKHLDALHPHTFRHTWCTLTVNDPENGPNRLHEAKDHMGHGSITMTERYVAR